MLEALARARDTAAAVVIWAPGRTADELAEAIGPHGFEHGSVDELPAPNPGALATLFATEADAEADLRASHHAAHARVTTALAIMPAYNEADVIFHAIGDLISQGVDVHLIDHGSTDGTREAAEPWLGRGLVRIERFPEDSGFPERNLREMVWRDILRRVSEVASAAETDWCLFVNADEFRETPWTDMTLAEGLGRVGELGFTAVNFELLNFRPTEGDAFRPGDDVREHLLHFEGAGRFDVVQIKAWKRQPDPVDLVERGGHDVRFPGRRVFPVPFLLRHYPIRGTEHGRRKVLTERLGRFAAEERSDGWHVQYDHYGDDSDFLYERSELRLWNADRVRAELLGRALGDLLLSTTLTGTDLEAPASEWPRIEWLTRRGHTPDAVSVDLASERLTEAKHLMPELPYPALQGLALDLAESQAALARVRGDVLDAARFDEAAERLESDVAAPAPSAT